MNSKEQMMKELGGTLPQSLQKEHYHLTLLFPGSAGKLAGIRHRLDLGITVSHQEGYLKLRGSFFPISNSNIEVLIPGCGAYYYNP